MTNKEYEENRAKREKEMDKEGILILAVFLGCMLGLTIFTVLIQVDAIKCFANPTCEMTEKSLSNIMRGPLW